MQVKFRDKDERIEQLEGWVRDLQRGCYINCVYCGHRYGPNIEEVPADALRKHVAMCRDHPMAELITACQNAILVIDGRRGQARTILHEAIQAATA